MKNLPRSFQSRHANSGPTLLTWLVAALIGVSTGWSASVTLIPPGSTWKYNDTGTDLGTSWRVPEYNDVSWTQGAAQLGYGDGDEATVVSYGPNASDKHRTCYFRHSFAVANPDLFATLHLAVLRDDGCVVYLNGQEVARYGMPAGEIAYSTFASSASDYSWDAPLAINNLLVPGENVIAVEVHQGNATSSDLSFDLNLTGTSEITLTLDAPAGGTAGVAIPAVLTATASDPAGQPLSVAFFGRPAPPSVPDFTVVVLPDTQFYVDEINGGTKEMFISQTDWIVNNREARNIVYVAHMGDVSNNGDTYVDEWQNATNALYRLEPAIPGLFPDGIPYGAAVGNHDQYVPGGDTEPTTYFNQYLGISHFQGRSYYGGHYGNNNNNCYQLFSASGLDFVVIYLEYDTTPDQAVLDWADAVLKTYAERRAIVVTHYFLNLDSTFGTQGAAIYGALKDNSNLALMLCGHNHGETRRTDVYEGNTVHTLLADFQSNPNGGNGFLRLLEFSPDNNQIRVKTYSPWLNQSETDADSDFTLNYPMQTGPAYQLVQQNNDVPSGETTTAFWSDLIPGTQYEWRVSASNGAEIKTSEVRRFTASANTPPTVAITSPANGSVIPAGGNIVVQAEASDSDGQIVNVVFYAGTTQFAEVDTPPYEAVGYFGVGSYVLTCMAVDNAGGTTMSAPVQITVGGPPEAPTGLTATAQSSTEILLSWQDNSANENGLEIYQSDDGSNYSLIGSHGPDTIGVLVTGLQPATAYFYFVRIFNNAGYADSVVATATTHSPPPVPSAPSDLTATPWSDSEVRLAWADNSTGETGFQIERSLDGVTWAVLRTETADTTSAIDVGLNSGTAYFYRVSACNAAGCSSATALAAAAPFILSLADGETLVSATQTGTYVDTHASDTDNEQLTERTSGGKPNTRYSMLEHKWTFNVTPGRSLIFFVQAYQTPGNDGDNFRFAYSTDDVIYHDMVLVTPSTEAGEYMSFPLPAALQGRVFVRVQDTDHTAGHSDLDTLNINHLLIRSDVSPVMTPPQAPALQEAGAGDGFVTLTWTPSAGATSYTVWRRTAGGSFAVIAAELGAVSYRDDSVVNDVAYEYVVSAMNQYGESEFSNVIQATPQAPTVTAPPSNLSAAAAKKKINLSWLQSSTPGVTQNRIYRSSSGGAGTYALLNTIPAATSYSDTVPSGASQYYVVTAVGANGESEPSNAVFATAK